MKSIEMASRIFSRELSLIRAQGTRDFVLECFDKVCPDYFWERAASKGGYYHPKFVTGNGGLVRHVAYAVWWAQELLRSTHEANDDSLGPYGDEVIGALLLHDCVKDGDAQCETPPGGWKMVQYHGVLMAQRIKEKVIGNRKPTKTEALIMAGIAGHMGKWTFPENCRPNNLPGIEAQYVAHMVARADYCASRKVDGIIPVIEKIEVN